jgi:hypothetical protein
MGREQHKIVRLHYSALAESVHYKGKMKRRHATLTLISLHTKMDTRLLLLLKGGAPQ